MSRVLVVATLLFVAVASGLLMWDALAMNLAHVPPAAHGRPWRARLQLATGAIVFAIVLWIALGLLSQAW